MKPKLLIPLLLTVSLAVPATAMAMQYAPTYTGNKFASRSQTGTCGARKVLTTAVMHCSGTGSVTIRYPFKLKDGCGPNVMPSVVAVGDAFTYGARSGRDGSVQVWVRIAGRAQLTVSTVTLRYYC
jgi:hypothetical protein